MADRPGRWEARNSRNPPRRDYLGGISALAVIGQQLRQLRDIRRDPPRFVLA